MNFLKMHDNYGRSPWMVKLLAVLTILLVDGVWLHSMRDCIVVLSEVCWSDCWAVELVL